MTRDRTLTAEEKRLWRQAMGEEPREREPAKAIDALEKKPTAKKDKPPLAVQTGRMAKRAISPRGTVEATLDLHGLSKIEAYSEVLDFITGCHRRGLRHLVIITGKGRTSEGILRAHLPHWLNEPILRRCIGSIAQAGRDRGGEGVFHVLLKQNEP